MKPLTRRNALKMFVTTAGLTTVMPLDGESAEPENHEVKGSDMNLKIPGSLKAEHEELHEELGRATRVGGKTGDAAQAVAKVLHPHFVKE